MVSCGVTVATEDTVFLLEVIIYLQYLGDIEVIMGDMLVTIGIWE